MSSFQLLEGDDLVVRLRPLASIEGIHKGLVAVVAHCDGRPEVVDLRREEDKEDSPWMLVGDGKGAEGVAGHRCWDHMGDTQEEADHERRIVS